MIAWSADMTKWFYHGMLFIRCGRSRALRPPRLSGERQTTIKKRIGGRERGRQNDPAEQVAKKARTETKALQIPSDYTGIRAGSAHFSVGASVGGKKKLFAGRYGNMHLAALVYNAFVGANVHQAGYNHVEKYVSETELKQLQQKALSAVKQKRKEWDEKRSKCVADQDEDMDDVSDEEGEEVDEDGAPWEFSRC
jgi:hypothetical protein